MEGYHIPAVDAAALCVQAAGPVSIYDQLKTVIARVHPPTAEHSIRVRIHATRLGMTCGLAGRELTTLALAAEIHDIGKLYVPLAVLDRAGALSEADWEIIRQHPIWGAQIAKQLFPHDAEIAQCVLLHHERLDGSGYPRALRHVEMPPLPRVIAVADAFAALTEDRPYRPGFSASDAIRILTNEDAGKYDADVVAVLAGSIDQDLAA